MILPMEDAVTRYRTASEEGDIGALMETLAARRRARVADLRPHGLPRSR